MTLTGTIRRAIFAVEDVLIRRRLERRLNQIGSDAEVAAMRADVDRQITVLRWQ